jgi:hypothetical protein
MVAGVASDCVKYATFYVPLFWQVTITSTCSQTMAHNTRYALISLISRAAMDMQNIQTSRLAQVYRNMNCYLWDITVELQVTYSDS